MLRQPTKETQMQEIKKKELKIIDFSFNPDTLNYSITYSDGSRVVDCMKKSDEKQCKEYGRMLKRTATSFGEEEEGSGGEIYGGQSDLKKKKMNINMLTFLDLLNSDVVFKYIKQSCELQKNMIFLTDFFYNLANDSKLQTTLLERSILICYNIFDFNYLMKLNYNVTLITYISEELVSINEDKLYIDINPIQYNCRPSIYTIVPLNLQKIQLNTYFLYKLYELIVESDETILSEVDVTNIAPIEVEFFTNNNETAIGIFLRNQVLTINQNINSEDSFKILLIALQIGDVRITRRLYNSVIKHIEKYTNYRHINIYNYAFSNIGRNRNIVETDFSNIYTKKGFKLY